MAESLTALLEQASKYPLLTASEEKMLAKRIEKGDQLAKERMILSNVRLAVHVARRYQNQDVPLDDLVNEGIIGVQRAAEKFDWRKNLKFSTYAVWWIRHMIQRAIHREKSTIRVPGHILERRRRIDKYLRENPDANIADAAEELGITLEQAEDAHDGAKVVASLDAPFPGEEYGDRYGLIPDEGAPDPADLLDDRNPHIKSALAKLPPLHKRVIELRFGFSGPVMSRDQVAEALSIRPHAVQRAQRQALIRLKEELGPDVEELIS